MDDIISRKAAIDALEEPYKVSDTWIDVYAIGKRAQWEMDVKALNSLPTIDPVKHGEWINSRGLYKCSVCRELWTAWWAVSCPEERMYETMKFCPNCGAKMGRSEE